MQARTLAWLGSLLIVGGAALGYAEATPQFDAAGGPRVVCFALMGAAGLLSVFLFPGFKRNAALVSAIWIPAIVVRLLLLPTAPSDDLSRYLWEGQLVRAGVSPYTQTADADAVSQYRDTHWEGMNHKDKATAYPPLSELGFAAVGAIAYHPLAYKIAFVLADLLTLAGVLALLRQRGLGLQYSGFYALSPVILISYAGEGHFDAWMVAALVWGVWAGAVGREKLSVVLVSIATGVKWIALPLLPFFIFGIGAQSASLGMLGGLRKRSPYVLLAVLTLVLPALFFWQSLPALWEGLLRFGGTRSFNGPVYDALLLGLGLPRGVCTAIVVGSLMSVCVWRWRVRASAEYDAHIRWILGALIVLSPTVHFWYLAWVLPFVCLRPSLPWGVLSLTSGVYFFVWSNEAWGLTVVQRWVFWMPFFLALGYEVWSTRGAVLRGMRRCGDSSAPTITVVVPTLNAASDLPQALASIEAQTRAVDEVIIVDSGSEDETLEIAKRASLPVRVLNRARGRGVQIAAGIEEARSDWVLVLHADAELAPEAVDCLLRAVTCDRAVIGGALGQRFSETNIELLPIEVLNDLRALFSRTAFGDQVQFFHRTTAAHYDLMPQQMLMEDVESSWRTRELGGVLFLGQPCRVSHQKWQAKDWWKRVKLVMRLVSRYRIARLRSREQAEALSDSLYREYYNSGK